MEIFNACKAVTMPEKVRMLCIELLTNPTAVRSPYI